MKLLLEADFRAGEIRFARENKDGFIVSQLPVATIESPNIKQVLDNSAEIAAGFGWSISSEWQESESGVVMWAYVEPTPTKVSFICSEIVSEETAASYAQMAGFSVAGVAHQELVADEGKVIATLRLHEPFGWTYDDFTANEPFAYDDEPFVIE